MSGAPLMLGQVLGQFRDLNVVPEEEMAAAKRRLRIPLDVVPDASQLRLLAAATGGWTAVTGNIFAVGTRLRVVLQALDVPTSRVIVRAEREVDAGADLRETFDALSVRLLEPAGVPASGVSLVALTTKSVDAYRAYARGVELYRRAAHLSAMDAFGEAVKLDSTFALAWSSLAFVTVSARGFQEVLNPGSIMYRAVERTVRHGQQLPAMDAALVRAMHAFTRARIVEARRISDSLIAAHPLNVSALEFGAVVYGMSAFVNQTTSMDQMAADANRAVMLTRRLLDLDPSRRMVYGLAAMVHGLSGGLFWGHTWSDTREFTSLPFLLMTVTTAPQGWFVPLFRDSIYFVPGDTFEVLPVEEQRRLRRPGADRAMQWVEEWLASGPDDADAHLWASRIAELQGDFRRALREFEIADSLGIQTGLESGPGRRLSLLVLTGDHARAGAYADSLLAMGMMKQPPFLSAVDRRWSYGVAALLLSRRWESAGRLAEVLNVRRKLTPACQSLGHEIAMVDFPAPEEVRREVMDTVSAHSDAVRATTALAPCERMLSTTLVPTP